MHRPAHVEAQLRVVEELFRPAFERAGTDTRACVAHEVVYAPAAANVFQLEIQLKLPGDGKLLRRDAREAREAVAALQQQHRLPLCRGDAQDSGPVLKRHGAGIGPGVVKNEYHA